MKNNFLFSSESVTEGHPDKVSDKISDTVLDAYLKQDPHSRVACETLVTTGLVVLAGEVSSQGKEGLDYQRIIREAIREIGYNEKETEGFSADSVAVLNSLHSQSADIAQGVDRGADKEIGAGDQGIMFGFACDETPELMPQCIDLAHKLSGGLSRLRKSRDVDWLRPDGKSQVTVRYENGKPVELHTVVISTQHDAKVSQEEIKDTLLQKLIKPSIPSHLDTSNTIYHINPTGNFVIGGPHGDAGLTGRKIIVDTYGGYAPHGGGAFSGKDGTKVDRSAAYMSRYVAKNVVAAGLASKFQLQLAYAIGVSEPVSIHLEAFGTEKVELSKIHDAIREIFSFTPGAIMDKLNLRSPRFAKTTNYGHFGREDAELEWEKTDQADTLKSYFSL